MRLKYEAFLSTLLSLLVLNYIWKIPDLFQQVGFLVKCCCYGLLLLILLYLNIISYYFSLGRE